VSKVFSRELVNLYQDHNYFGCSDTGQSEEQQEALKKAWIEAMRQRGWILDDSIIENDNEYLGEVVDLWLEFDHACQVSLEIAHDIVDSH